MLEAMWYAPFAPGVHGSVPTAAASTRIWWVRKDGHVKTLH
jgi:hypothetical protein